MELPKLVDEKMQPKVKETEPKGQRTNGDVKHKKGEAIIAIRFLLGGGRYKGKRWTNKLRRPARRRSTRTVWFWRGPLKSTLRARKALNDLNFSRDQGIFAALSQKKPSHRTGNVRRF